MKSESVQPATPGQFKDIIATIIGAVPTKLTRAEADAILARKGRLVKDVRNVCKTLSGASGAWHAMRIGAETKESILEKVAKTRVKVWAKRMLEGGCFVVASRPQMLSLAMRTLRELGFETKPKLEEISARVAELGHTICPPEVAPLLWIYQAEMEIEDGSYSVLMDPLPDGNGEQAIFSLGIHNHVSPDQRASSHWLSSSGGIRRNWDLDSKVIFVLGEE